MTEWRFGRGWRGDEIGERLRALDSLPRNFEAEEPEMTAAHGWNNYFLESVVALGNRLFAQNAAMGALPTLYAATAPDVRGADYIGPSSVGELWGSPRKVGSNARSRDRETAARLWKVSEELTGVRYPI